MNIFQQVKSTQGCSDIGLRLSFPQHAIIACAGFSCANLVQELNELKVFLILRRAGHIWSP